ncbi:cell envelope integrity protein CreD [Opitutales bacterium]|nr:cell envelope integrity protein CreD [Opitutales bacterium]
MPELPSPIPQHRNQLRSSLTLKLVIIGILTGGLLILTIPLFVVINDREDRRDEVVEEISSKWGRDQTIYGPVLTVPYHHTIVNRSSNGRSSTTKKTQFLHFLPDNLEINATVVPEMKYRGIFETVVYESVLRIRGSFRDLDWDLARVEETEILKERASLCIGIPDVRGIREATSITFLGQKFEAKPGLPTQEVLSSGISSLINLKDDNGSMVFDIELHLDGSSSLAFSPLGKTTSIEMNSPWTTPSFDGAFLPLEKNIGTDGFSAFWKVLHLNRSIPHAWTGAAPSSGGGANWKNGQLFAGPANILGDFAFGVKFYLPNDVYQKTTRMAKYAILFLVFGFTSFFFTEILQKAQVHPIQYLLIGFAILVFYLLLLSLSEHFGFDRAYLVSTAAVVFLIGSYASAILSSQKLAISVSAVLSILYGYLYVILQLESYALLMGSLGLFGALTLAMFFTRKIDWYSLRLPSADSK